MTIDDIETTLKLYKFSKQFIDEVIKNYLIALDENIPFPLYFSIVKTKI